jgi:hypothetical protein
MCFVQVFLDIKMQIVYSSFSNYRFVAQSAKVQAQKYQSTKLQECKSAQ